MTPLAASPLAGDVGAPHPGVKFEPEGLIFAEPAILTLDLSATGHVVTDNDFLFLFTSPLTALPLYGQADPQTSTITAELPHFSIAGARNAPAPYVDFAAWTNAYLASASFPSPAVLRTLTSLARLQGQIGCTGANCINRAQLAARIRSDIEALVQRSCPLDIGDPSDAALTRYLALETLAQAANVQVPLLRQCVARVLEALIDKTYQNGIAAPFNQAHLERLVELTSRAQLLGLTSAQNLGRRRIEDLLRVMINYEAADAAATPTEAALDRVTRLHQLAQQLGLANLETLAARGLATALRVLLTRGRQLCSGSDGSGGLILLYRAQNYASIVTQVDAALDSEIQAAIEACQGTSMRVTFLKDSGGQGSFGYTSLFDREVQARYCERRTPLAVDTRAPLTFEPAACAPNSLKINASVLQNGLALDANAFTAEDGILRTSLSMSIDFQRAGTLSAEVNTSWATAGTFCFVTLSQADSSPYALLVNWDWTGSNSNAVLGTVPIANPTVRKYLFYLDCNSPDLGNTPQGSGRLLTLRFTPSP